MYRHYANNSFICLNDTCHCISSIIISNQSAESNLNLIAILLYEKGIADIPESD